MLYGECRQYLAGRLKAAGIKSKVHTTMKSLEKSQESHLGAVLFESEDLSRNYSRTYYTDQEGARKKRQKVFERKLTFSVVIGGYTDEEVETVFEKFLGSLDRGIWVDGNFVPLEAGAADWVDKDDSILKAQVAVQARVTFDGGLYKDTGSGRLSRMEVEVEDRNRGKE